MSGEGVGVAGGDRKAKAVVGEQRSRDQLANEEQEDPYGGSTDEEMESDVGGDNCTIYTMCTLYSNCTCVFYGARIAMEFLSTPQMDFLTGTCT